MIIKDHKLLDEFSKYFNSRLNVLDFINKTNDFNNPDFDLEFKNEYRLVVLNKRLFEKIKDSSYADLLKSVISRIKIEDEIRDVFESQLDKDLIENVWEFVLKNQTANVVIKLDEPNLTFRVLGYDLLIDLFAQPLTELHHEVVETFAQFLEIDDIMAKTGGSISNNFLNPNSSSAFSNFLQLYVAENLGMNIKGNDGVIVT